MSIKKIGHSGSKVGKCFRRCKTSRRGSCLAALPDVDGDTKIEGIQVPNCFKRLARDQ